jgi:hypothetical protein
VPSPEGRTLEGRAGSAGARAGALLAVLRAIFLAVAAVAALSLPLIAFHLIQAGPLGWHRFREPTWVLYGALALFAVLRPDPRAYLGGVLRRAREILDSPRFFPAASGILLAIYLLVGLTTHLSFHTFSHDFSMFDELLYWSHHGRPFFTPIYGGSFLGAHVSPILMLLVPLHWLAPSPYLLVLLHPLLLWAAVLPLRGLLDAQGVPRAVRNLACVVYLTNPITVATLDYGFHLEVFLPVLTFGLFLAHRRGPAWAYWALLAGALGVKEDVGLYVAGLGAYLFAAERRRARGAITTLCGVLATLAALYVVIPRLNDKGYGLMSLWSQWGSGPVEIVLAMATHPLALLGALLAPSYLLFFYRLGGTPFLARWSILLFGAPWVITATSGLAQQARLGIYYGLPLLVYSGLASAAALGGATMRRVYASRWAPPLAALVVTLNVAHFTFFAVPRERWDVLRVLGDIPRGATVQAMPCFFPVLRYEQQRALLMPGDRLTADYVVLRSAVTAWPFRAEEVERAVREALESGGYASRYGQGGFWVLERAGAISQ